MEFIQIRGCLVLHILSFGPGPAIIYLAVFSQRTNSIWNAYVQCLMLLNISI